MRNQFVLYTTIYPGVEGFLSSWYQSVASQTDPGFDLFIALDGLEIEEVFSAVGRNFYAYWHRAHEGGTPASLREHAFTVLAERYESVIFVDSDDLLELNRVERAKMLLRQYDMAACSCRLIDAQGNRLNGGIISEETKYDQGFLVKENVFGLSNSACRTGLLKKLLPIPADCRLVDWFLATKAWILGAKMGVDTTCGMAYRQHVNNIASVLKPFTAEYILRAAKMVLHHYDLVAANILPEHPAYQPLFAQRREEVAEFYQAMHADTLLLDRYTEACNTRDNEYSWWACVAHPALENLWRN